MPRLGNLLGCDVQRGGAVLNQEEEILPDGIYMVTKEDENIFAVTKENQYILATSKE